MIGSGVSNASIYPRLPRSGLYWLVDVAKWTKLNAGAQEPFKIEGNELEPGWMITLIGRDENRAEDNVNDVNVFTTGLSLIPPRGFHFEVVPDDSLVNQGYMFVGPKILSPTDTNELYITLFKFKECDDLELPFAAIQIVLRETIYSGLNKVVLSDKVEEKSVTTSFTKKLAPRVRKDTSDNNSSEKKGKRKMF